MGAGGWTARALVNVQHQRPFYCQKETSGSRGQLPQKIANARYPQLNSCKRSSGCLILVQNFKIQTDLIAIAAHGISTVRRCGPALFRDEHLLQIGISLRFQPQAANPIMRLVIEFQDLSCGQHSFEMPATRSTKSDHTVNFQLLTTANTHVFMKLSHNNSILPCLAPDWKTKVQV